MGRITRVLIAVLVVGGMLVAPATRSAAETGTAGLVAVTSGERPVVPPAGTYRVPVYRPVAAASPRLVVCAPDSRARVRKLDGDVRSVNDTLLRECAYRNVQQAVDAVKTRGSTIYVLPGRYREEPSRRTPEGQCRKLADKKTLTYAEEHACPNLRNLIGVFGDEYPADGRDRCAGPRCDLQIEGTGARQADVVIEGGYTAKGKWAKSMGIRADRADGLYIRNLTVRSFGSSGVRVVQTDGFVLDKVDGHANGRQGLSAFAADHGVIAGCWATGNGDAGIATDSVADLRGKRSSVEVRGCTARGNLVGYSGTAGDSVYVHDNEFSGNSAGLSVDSAENLPGMPQNNAHFVANRVHGNNADHYRWVRDGVCAKPPAKRGKNVLCPVRAVPVGTGLLVAGGDYNTFAANLVYGNWRYGAAQFWVPATQRGEQRSDRYRDTSHGNRYVGNLMGFTPEGKTAPNGTDFWWDEQGDRNCWKDNKSAWGSVRADPAGLPGCDKPSAAGSPGDPRKTGLVAACLKYSAGLPAPAGCPWLSPMARPVL